MTVLLDTLAIARKLESAGFSEDQAEAVTHVVRDAQEAGLSGLATKVDLREIEVKVDKLEARLETKIDALEVRLETKISALGARFDAKIDGLRKDMRGDIQAVKSNMARWLVITQAALAGFIFTVLKFLHETLSTRIAAPPDRVSKGPCPLAGIRAEP